MNTNPVGNETNLVKRISDARTQIRKSEKIQEYISGNTKISGADSSIMQEVANFYFDDALVLIDTLLDSSSRNKPCSFYRWPPCKDLHKQMSCRVCCVRNYYRDSKLQERRHQEIAHIDERSDSSSPARVRRGTKIEDALFYKAREILTSLEKILRDISECRYVDARFEERKDDVNNTFTFFSRIAEK